MYICVTSNILLSEKNSFAFYSNDIIWKVINSLRQLDKRSPLITKHSFKTTGTWSVWDFFHFALHENLSKYPSRAPTFVPSLNCLKFF